jgi:carboxyl-terminal processing protease
MKFIFSLILFLSTVVSFAQTQPTRPLVAHSIHALIAIPQSWTFNPNNYTFGQGEDFVSFSPIFAADTLETACHQTSENAMFGTKPDVAFADFEAGIASCKITPVNQNSVKAVVIEHPHPFLTFGGETKYVMIMVTPEYFESILASLSFEFPGSTLYVESMLEIIQGSSYFGLNLSTNEWNRIKRTAVGRIKSETDLTEAHKALRYVISQLRGRAGDNHSFFFSPEEAMEMFSNTSSDTRFTYKPPTARRLNTTTALLNLPAISGTVELWKEYAATAQQAIQEVDDSQVRCWIVDLRENSGGSMDPMIVGAAPILGNGILSGFKFTDGTQSMFSLRQTHLIEEGESRSEPLVEESYLLHVPNPPVAVLQGALTGSSGEFTLLSFIGRKNTRTFGTHTAGLSTGNVSLYLFDGAQIGLAAMVGMDRNRNIYPHGIAPDQEVIASKTDEDVVLEAALSWLETEHNCTA